MINLINSIILQSIENQKKHLQYCDISHELNYKKIIFHIY